MLFRSKTLRGIEKGEITLAFRRWRKPSVRPGSTLKTAVGVISIEAVEPVGESAITPREAQDAGFPSLEGLRAELELRDSGSIYRIVLSYAGPDPRIALRENDRLTSDELTTIMERLAKLDRASRQGAWTTAVLGLIKAQPGVRAGDLAALIGQEKQKFKLNVRKLKNLGLTESLETGYRLSPRGKKVLKALEED